MFINNKMDKLRYIYIVIQWDGIQQNENEEDTTTHYMDGSHKN